MLVINIANNLNTINKQASLINITVYICIYRNSQTYISQSEKALFAKLSKFLQQRTS